MALLYCDFDVNFTKNIIINQQKYFNQQVGQSASIMCKLPIEKNGKDMYEVINIEKAKG